METLRIYEIDYSCSPGGYNQFEVYADIDNDYETGGMPIYVSDTLIEATSYCDSLGLDYTIMLLEEYRLLDTPDLPLTAVSGI
jgi:hypothetical protein